MIPLYNLQRALLTIIFFEVLGIIVVSNLYLHILYDLSEGLSLLLLVIDCIVVGIGAYATTPSLELFQIPNEKGGIR
jgi:hypothetical protein